MGEGSREIIGIVIVVALARFGAMALFGAQSTAPQHAILYSLCFLPTGVNAVAMLAGGYWAAAGVGLGTLVWNMVEDGITTRSDFEVSLLTAAVCLIALGAFERLAGRNRASRWRSPTLNEIAMLFAIYALVHSVLLDVGLPLIFSGAASHLGTFVVMAIGDFLGAAAAFVMLNIAVSGFVEFGRAFRVPD